MSFDVAQKIQIELPAQFHGLAGEIVSFGLFPAVAQDADARVGIAEDFPRIDAAHDGELRQVQRLALGIGAGIQQQKVFLRRRKNYGDRRALDVFQRAQSDRGRGHQTAGVAARNHRVALALLDQLQGASHGAVLFLAQDVEWLVLHREHFGGVNDFDAVVLQASFGHCRPDLCFVTHEAQLGDFAAGVERDFDALNDNLTAVVATHDIHYDSHKEKSAEGAIPHPRSKTGTQARASTVTTCRPL